MVFQMMFAIITPALIVASLAERMKFSAFIIFIVLWSTFVYDFAAHWTWQIATENYGANPDYCGFGWTGCLGSLDFAGGTVIHITSGWAGLVIALMLGTQTGLWQGCNGASQHIFSCPWSSVAVGRMVWIQCWFSRMRLELMPQAHL